MRPIIFFDWDGTIADSMDLCVGGLVACLTELGYPIPERSRMEACNGPAYDASADIMGIAPADRARFLALRRAAEMRILPQTQHLYPDMAGIMRRLHEVADLAIVSNGLADYILTSMQVTGLDAKLFSHVSAFQPGRSKTEALRALLAQTRPDHAVMVGDCEGDILAGLDNGLPTLAAAYGYGDPEVWRKADAAVSSPAALENSLTRWALGQPLTGDM